MCWIPTYLYYDDFIFLITWGGDNQELFCNISTASKKTPVNTIFWWVHISSLILTSTPRSFCYILITCPKHQLGYCSLEMRWTIMSQEVQYPWDTENISKNSSEKNCYKEIYTACLSQKSVDMRALFLLKWLMGIERSSEDDRQCNF